MRRLGGRMLTFGLAGGILAAVSAAIGRAGPATVHGSSAPVALVELYTSEGCSSCPPAETVLSELGDAKRRVYGVSFHVDYWDNAAWTDPFSNRAFSERQRAIARTRRQNRVYTPQMFVNGGQDFVGADRRAAEQSIQTSLRQACRAWVDLACRFRDDRTLEVGFRVGGKAAQSWLNVAVTESGLERQVTGGECEGRTLKHDHVVRAYQMVQTTTGHEGQVVLALPDDLQRENAAVVAWLQEAGTLRVSGATHVSLAEAE